MGMDVESRRIRRFSPVLVGVISVTIPSTERPALRDADSKGLFAASSSGPNAQKATARDPRAMRSNIITIFSSFCILMISHPVTKPKLRRKLCAIVRKIFM